MNFPTHRYSKTTYCCMSGSLIPIRRPVEKLHIICATEVAQFESL